MSHSSEAEIFKVIKSVSYPNNKSKHLFQMSKVLYNDFGGEVPQEIDDLQKLPGVGRKTANVIASVLFNKPVIAVDTHVFRVAKRLGLSSAKDVLGVELDLTANIPQEKRATAHHWLILHGRYTCKARNPQCNTCGLRPYCKFYSEQQAI
ncbi:Endonuclease III [bioreactor metagenome]|uniref:Endonuclease III n=1 Tax=bioreactor metagenome TaxID=1076179 RepID=A0A645BXG9_9ZZZZ